MKHLEHLHEEFIEKAQRHMRFGALPIAPSPAEAPVIAVDRWKLSNKALYKTYKFRRITDRDTFVLSLFSFERATEHNAQMTIDHDEVSLKLQTKDINNVTELDKEYASYADTAFRDIVYSQGIESSDANEG